MLPFRFRNPDTAQATVATLAIGPAIVIPTMFFMGYLSFEATLISLVWFAFITLYVLGVVGTSLITMSAMSTLKQLDSLSGTSEDGIESKFFEIDLGSDPDALDSLKEELEKMAKEVKEAHEKDKEDDD